MAPSNNDVIDEDNGDKQEDISRGQWMRIAKSIIICLAFIIFVSILFPENNFSVFFPLKLTEPVITGLA